MNIRKALNFGHTIGHAVETLFLETETPLRHGEAIAIGMMCEAFLSFKKVGLPEDEFQIIFDFFQKKYPQVYLPKEDFPTLINWMRKDKKNENDELIAVKSSISKTNQVSYMKDFMGFHSLENISNKKSMSLHLYAKPIRKCKVFDEDSKGFINKEMSYHTTASTRIKKLN